MITDPLFPGHSREIDTTSSHFIVWEFDRDTVTGKVECRSGADANCHQTASCDCESWSIERDEAGIAYHLAWDEHEKSGEDVEVRHYMYPRDECNVMDWLNEGDLMESADRDVAFEIAHTAISPVWNDDHFLWAPAAGWDA